MNVAASAATASGQSRFESDVLDGLSAHPKALPSQWFYDTHGSELFEAITHLPEYYLTRAEIALLQRHAPEIAAHIGAGATVVEFGSGSSRKTPLVLEALDGPARYVPVDIAADFLQESVRALKSRMPWLECQPVAADLNDAGAWSAIARLLGSHDPKDGNGIARSRTDEAPRVMRGNFQPEGNRSGVASAAVATKSRDAVLGMFLGSSIGNFDPDQARQLMARMAKVLGAASWLLMGVDSTREPTRLLPAYDDAQGVTAQFNLNLLRRINRELGADFDLESFAHEVRFLPERDRLEMHLVSRRPQIVRISGKSFAFAEGESLHTENCHKYTCARFEALAKDSGWTPLRRWGGSDESFGLYLLRSH